MPKIGEALQKIYWEFYLQNQANKHEIFFPMWGVCSQIQ